MFKSSEGLLGMNTKDLIKAVARPVSKGLPSQSFQSPKGEDCYKARQGNPGNSVRTLGLRGRKTKDKQTNQNPKPT